MDGNRPPLSLSLGAIYMSLAALFIALVGAMIKGSPAHLSTASIVFWRSCMGLLLMLPWIAVERKLPHPVALLKKKSLGLLLVRGIAGLTTIYLLFYSYKFLTIANATLLYNTLPIFVPIVAWVWKRLPIPHRLWWGLSLSFLGIVLLLHPGKEAFQLAAFLALASGITGAISSLALRFSHFHESTSSIIFYFFLLSTIISVVPTFFPFAEHWLELTPRDCLFLIGIGVFAFCAQILSTLAVKHAPVRLISSLNYLAVVFGMMFDHWIWGHAFSTTFIAGFLLILIGTGLTLYLYPKEQKPS